MLFKWFWMCCYTGLIEFYLITQCIRIYICKHVSVQCSLTRTYLHKLHIDFGRRWRWAIIAAIFSPWHVWHWSFTNILEDKLWKNEYVCIDLRILFKLQRWGGLSTKLKELVAQQFCMYMYCNTEKCRLYLGNKIHIN